MAVTAQQLSEQLVKAGLLNDEQIQACCESAGAALASVAPEVLAKQLVKNGRLTLFQAQMAVNGKSSSLVIGSYVVLEKIGQGGMGQVFKARHKTMKREVALKVISPAVVKDELSRRRFQREVEAAAQLNHPNIVTAHDAGEFRGTHYLVMEYIRGSDLASVVKKSGPLNAATAVSLVLQTARGLACAHGNGIVHRDIKPANLLLDESGTLKILDMGLARIDALTQDQASAAGLTGTGMLMGTIDYMSPEQAMDSKTADARSDIYSLGCTLYFLLTGKPVYDEDTVVKRLMAHQSMAIPSLPILDQTLQLMFERMIAKKPEQRYQSADQLVADLQRWLDEHTVASVKSTREMPTAGNSGYVVEEFSGPVEKNSGPESAPGLKPLGVITPAMEKRSETTPANTAMEQTVVPQPTKKSAPVRSALAEIPKEEGSSAATNQPEPSRLRHRVNEINPQLALEEFTASSRRRNTRLVGSNASRSDAAGPTKRRLLFGGIGGAAILALVAVVVIRLKTPGGTTAIETNQPEIASAGGAVDEQQKLALETGDGQKPLGLSNTESAPDMTTDLAAIPLNPRVDSVPAMPPAESPPPQPLVDPPAETSPAPTVTEPEPVPSLAGTLAPQELRLQEGTGPRPPFSEQLKPGDPLGEFAAVSRPAKVEGLLSWSIEPLMHRASVRSTSLSSKGIIATGGLDSVIRLWTTDWQLIKVLPGHANEVLAVEFSPDGQRLASVARDPRAMVAMWDVESGHLLWSKVVSNWSGRLSWAPDSTRLAVCEPSRLLILDPATGNPQGELASPVYLIDAAWSSDSRQLCVVNDGQNTVRIVDASTLKVTHEFPHAHGQTDADWSADGHLVAVAGNGSVGIFDADTFGGRHTLLKNASGLAFSPDSSRLAISDPAGTTVFDTSNWSEIWHQPANPGDAGQVSWHKDGTWFVSGIFRYDAVTGQRLNALPPAIPRTIAGPVPDGARVATVSNNVLRIWNGDDGSLLDEFREPRSASMQLLWNTPGSRLLRLGAFEGKEFTCVEVIDPATGKTLHLLDGHTGHVWRTCWSKEGTLAATVGEDGQCIIWNTESGQQVLSMKHREPQWWVQWSADESSIACGSQTVITVWDTATGQLKRTFSTLSERMFGPGASAGVDAPFSFMQDSNQITVLAKDNGFELLNVKTGQITSLGSVTGQGGTSRFTAAWSPDDRFLASACQSDVDLFQKGTTESKSFRFFASPHWLSDGKRIFGGDNFVSFVSAFDTKTMRRIGVLLPELPHGEYIAIGPDGNYTGSPKCGEQAVVVALHDNGSLKTYSLDEFASTFGWVNDPAKVRFLKAR